MATITIDIDNDIVANAFALWLDNDAIESFIGSNEYELMMQLANEKKHLLKESEVIQDVDWIEVEFGNGYHEATIHLTDLD